MDTFPISFFDSYSSSRELVSKLLYKLVCLGGCADTWYPNGTVSVPNTAMEVTSQLVIYCPSLMILHSSRRTKLLSAPEDCITCFKERFLSPDVAEDLSNMCSSSKLLRYDTHTLPLGATSLILVNPLARARSHTTHARARACAHTTQEKSLSPPLTSLDPSFSPHT